MENKTYKIILKSVLIVCDNNYYLSLIPYETNLYFLIFSWWYGFRCFFGGAGCSATPGVRGTMFILMYVLSYIGSANLLRHAEGATWLAIVVVSDLVFVF